MTTGAARTRPTSRDPRGEWMIICSQCGERNPDGEQFCGSCNAFLEWEGAAVDPGAQAGPPQPGYGRQPGVPNQPQAGYGQAPPAGQVPAGPGQVPAGYGQAPAPYGQAPAGSAPAPAGYGQPPAGYAQVPAGYGTPPPAGGQQGGYAPAGYGQPPAGYGQPPGQPPVGYGQPGAMQPGAMQPGDGQPGAVQPGEMKRRRYVPPPEEPVVNPGDVVCRSCGTPNEPTRSFCRMCGNPLAGSPPAGMAYGGRVEKVGWWRRHFGRQRPQAAVHEAGDRPQPKPKRRWVKWVSLLVVVAGIAVVAVGPGKTWITQLKNTIAGKTSKPVPFIPDSFGASSSASGHAPAKAGDGVTNQFWAPPTGRGANEWLEARFSHPFNLTTIIITPGVSDDQGKFLAQARPQAVDVTVTSDNGNVTTKTITLTDRAGPQTFSVSAPGAEKIRLTIRSVYGQQSGHLVGIAEVEFFGRH